MKMSVLYKLSWIFVSQQQWVGKHATPLGHVICLRTNHNVFLLIKAACLAEGEAAITNLTVVDLTRQGIEPSPTALANSMLTITLPVSSFCYLCIIFTINSTDQSANLTSSIVHVILTSHDICTTCKQTESSLWI